MNPVRHVIRKFHRSKAGSFEWKVYSKLPAFCEENCVSHVEQDSWVTSWYYFCTWSAYRIVEHKFTLIEISQEEVPGWRNSGNYSSSLYWITCIHRLCPSNNIQVFDVLYNEREKCKIWWSLFGWGKFLVTDDFPFPFTSDIGTLKGP